MTVPVERLARHASMRAAARPYNKPIRCPPEISMKSFGTPLSERSLRVLLLGSGELGKEVAIELQRSPWR